MVTDGELAVGRQTGKVGVAERERLGPVYITALRVFVALYSSEGELMSQEEKDSSAPLEGGPPPEETAETQDQPDPDAPIGGEPSSAGPEHGGPDTEGQG